jgi:hypothetical protein
VIPAPLVARSPAVSDTVGMAARASVSDPAFWPRLARAAALMAVAVALHVWVVVSPYPQPASLPAFAAWIIATPGIPVSPSAGWLGSSRRRASSPGPVVVQSTLVRVLPPRTGDARSRDMRPLIPSPVGTTGFIVASASASAIKSSSLMHRVQEPLNVSSAPGLRSLPPASAPAGVAEPAATVAHATPAAAPPAPPPASTRAPAAASIEEDRRQKEIVLGVLREYSRAYERLDVRATKAVYPSVDDRSLQRAFENLKGQEMRFASCDMSISSSGADANARCKGDATYRLKIGSRVLRYTDRVWTFSLSRDGGGWQILDARMQ